jgi:hypothetical protein
MNTSDFQINFTVSQTADEVFNAVNNVRGWWSENIDGPTDILYGEFTYRYKDVHKCTMKLIDVIPGEKVVWQVLDNYFNFTEDKTEWIGTKIGFEISEKAGKTHLLFTHWGLNAEYECYNICYDAWTRYIKSSLFNLVTTGKGQPNAKEFAAV